MKTASKAPAWTHAGQAAVTPPLAEIPPQVLVKIAAEPGRFEDGAYQLHDGIGVFRWPGTIPLHVDSIPENQRTMGMVLINDGGFRLVTAESKETLALPVGAVWKINSHVPHRGIQTEPHTTPQFVGILWDFEIGKEPAPEWFAAEALGELLAWAA